MTEYRAVLVGCGKISQTWLRAIAEMQDLEIVGLVDLDEGQATDTKETFELSAATTGTDVRQMVDTLQPDMVFDCTHPKAHRAVTGTALEMGCHVLGEKPMADTYANALEMVKAAETSGKTYAVIQNRRYNDDIVRFRDIVQSGEIGALTTLNADFYKGSRFGDFRDHMEHVLLLDMAIHSFDEARYISGKNPISAYCHEWNPKGSWYDHGASAAVILEMEEGLVLNYRGSWCAEGYNTSWQCEWRALGSEGSALWDGQNAVNAQKVSESGMVGLCKQVEDVPVSAGTPAQHTKHAGVIREFLDCLTNGTTPQTDCSDNIKSVAMVHAAIRSAETGRKVSIEELEETTI
jgi:predicted dehydrogenase